MKYRTLAFGFLSVCLMTTAALLHRNSLASSRYVMRSNQSPMTAVDDSAVEVEVLTLDRRGFEPAEIRRPIGRFLLAISNHSEEQNLLFAIDRVAGGRVHAVNMARG